MTLRALLIPLTVATLIVMTGCGPSGPNESKSADDYTRVGDRLSVPD